MEVNERRDGGLADDRSIFAVVRRVSMDLVFDHSKPWEEIEGDRREITEGKRDF